MKKLRKNNKAIKEIIRFCTIHGYVYEMQLDELTITYSKEKHESIIKKVKEIIRNSDPKYGLTYTDNQTERVINIFDARI
jgi:hypothetical protein